MSGVTGLRIDATMDDVQQWLRLHRFDKYAAALKDFAGADLLRLSKDEVVELCGLANGLRFYNGLHSRSIRPKLTLYVTDAPHKPFQAIYLDHLTQAELNELHDNYVRDWNLGPEAHPCDLKSSTDPSGTVRSTYVPPPVLIA